MGAWSPTSKTNVATMGADDFRTNEKSVVLPGRRRPAHRARGRRRHDHRCCKESIPVLAGEVVDATVMRVAALRAFLTDADRPGQGRGRAVLGAPQGHDDEGLRPDHLRPRRPGLLPGAVRRVRRDARGRRASARTTASAPSWTPWRRCPRARPSRPPCEPGIADGPALAMVDSDRGITNLHVPSRRDRRRVDAGDDPHLRPHVGPGRPGGRHPRGDPGLAPTPASTRSSSTTAAPTAPSTRPRWARCPTSG